MDGRPIPAATALAAPPAGCSAASAPGTGEPPASNRETPTGTTVGIPDRGIPDRGDDDGPPFRRA